MHDRNRRRLRAASATLAAAGILAVGAGATAPRLAPDRDPLPLAAGAGVRAPDPGPFGGRVLLYGVPAGRFSGQPSGADLGCSSGGTRWTTTADGADRLVIGGQAVVPLLVMPAGAAGRTVRCTGPAATALTPLYLVTTVGVRDEVPMAAFSFASLALVLGGVGCWRLRPEPVNV